MSLNFDKMNHKAYIKLSKFSNFFVFVNQFLVVLFSNFFFVNVQFHLASGRSGGTVIRPIRLKNVVKII